jgi:hypothetical protein
MKSFQFTTPNLLIIVLALVLVAFLVWLASWSIKKSAEKKATKKAWTWFLIVFFLFVAALSALAIQGFYDAKLVAPRFLTIFLPVVVFIIMLSRKNMDGALTFLKTISPAWLVGIQVFRVAVELILAQLNKDGLVPVELTYHGRNFDLIIGALALPVAWLVNRRTNTAILIGTAWNIAGLLSLINILSIAVRSVPGPFFEFAKNYLPLYFPGILIPAVFVVLALLFHTASLKQLFFLRKQVPADMAIS